MTATKKMVEIRKGVFVLVDPQKDVEGRINTVKEQLEMNDQLFTKVNVPRK